MAENDEVETSAGDGEYVTKSELREMLQEILGGAGGNDGGDDDGEWEIVDLDELGDDLSDVVERLSAADVERIAEEKVQAAIAKLTAAKKSQPRKAAAPVKKETEKVVEVEPAQAGKKSLRSMLWGE